MTSKMLALKDLETDSASPEAGQVSPDTAATRKKETVKVSSTRKPQVNTVNIAYDEYELVQATIRRQEAKIVNLRQVYESEINNKDRELQIVKEKAKKIEQALIGTEKQLATVVKLQMIQLGKNKGERGMTSVQDSQTDSFCGENLVERDPLMTKLDSEIPKADPHLSHLAEPKAPFHLGTPCIAFDKVVQENLRLKKLCQELMSSNGKTTTTITLDNHEYEDIIKRLKQEVMQVKLELQNMRMLLILKENGQQDTLAEKLDELQQEKVKLSKSVGAKAYLLSMYNKEYERLKQAYIQLQQVLETHKAHVETGKLVERQPGDGKETSFDTAKSEALEKLTMLQEKHAQEMERLTVDKQLLQQEIIKLQWLNKTYAESIEELSRTRRTVDEQPISMADMRKELEKLRDDRGMYAEDIKRYTQKMDEMEHEIKTKGSDILKQKVFYDERMTQLQEQYQRLTKENTELQRQLGDVNMHNKQLRYQCSRSPHTSTESQSSLSGLSTQPGGQGIIVADGVDDDCYSKELVCARCCRTFDNPDRLKVHEKKCMDS